MTDGPPLTPPPSSPMLPPPAPAAPTELPPPTTSPAAATGAWASDATGPLRCRVCGGTPAIGVEFHQNIGLLLARRTRSWNGDACRDCGRSAGRRLMNLTLVTGWTGLISFFANIGNVATNTGALRRLSELAPAERPPGAPSPGRSVFLRPGIWVLAAALGAIGFAIAHAKPTPTWKTGACVRVEGAKASPVDCAADHDATVLDVVATGQPCPPGGRGVVVHDRKRYCIG